MDQVSEDVRWLEGRVSSLKVKEKEFSNGRPGKMWVLILDENFTDKKLSGFGDAPKELQEAADKEAYVRVAYSMNGNYRNYADKLEVIQKPAPVRIEKVFDGDKQADLIALLTQARDAFIQVYGREPKTDGEFAVCNSAFIWLQNRR